jgi:hypothetical protein
LSIPIRTPLSTENLAYILKISALCMLCAWNVLLREMEIAIIPNFTNTGYSGLEALLSAFRVYN